MPVLVPPVAVKTTVDPPEVSEFPAASLAVSVRVTALLEATLAAETEASDCATEADPGVTVNVGRVLVTAAPPIVAPMVVGLPATPPVKVAV